MCLDVLVASVDLLMEVRNRGIRLCDVLAIHKNVARVRRGIKFKLGCRREFDADIPRHRVQLPIVVLNRLYVEISPVGRTRKAASRAAHINSPGPFLYGCGGGADHHNDNVAISRLRADALRDARTGNVAVAGFGFDVLPDYLEIQISVINLGLQPLRYVRGLDVALARRQFSRSQYSTDVLFAPVQPRSDFGAIGHINPVENPDPQ
jgi:hypothetical protein